MSDVFFWRSIAIAIADGYGTHGGMWNLRYGHGKFYVAVFGQFVRYLIVRSELQVAYQIMRRVSSCECQTIRVSRWHSASASAITPSQFESYRYRAYLDLPWVNATFSTRWTCDDARISRDRTWLRSGELRAYLQLLRIVRFLWFYPF